MKANTAVHIHHTGSMTCGGNEKILLEVLGTLLVCVMESKVTTLKIFLNEASLSRRRTVDGRELTEQQQTKKTGMVTFFFTPKRPKFADS